MGSLTAPAKEPRDWAGMTKADREYSAALHKLFTEAQREHAEHVRWLDSHRRRRQ